MSEQCRSSHGRKRLRFGLPSIFRDACKHAIRELPHYEQPRCCLVSDVTHELPVPDPIKGDQPLPGRLAFSVVFSKLATSRLWTTFIIGGTCRNQ